jgi:transposase
VQRLNRYYRRSRIAEAKFLLLVRHFALDLHAADAAQLTGILHRSVITIFGKIRRRVSEECERQSPFKKGEVEVDESYFGPHRIRGKRGRGAGRKTIVFGLLKRDGRVYTEIVPDCKKATLQAIIRGRVSADAVIHSDGWRGYDGLVDVGYAKHFRVHHGANEFANNGESHINGIESFWSFAKRRLQKFNGVPVATFALHLKECEWRFNHRRDNLYLELLRLLRQYPL